MRDASSQPRQSSNLAAKPDCPSCRGTGWVTVFAGTIAVAGGYCRCVGGTTWAKKP
jgi:hypothetical protein